MDELIDTTDTDVDTDTKNTRCTFFKKACQNGKQGTW